MRLRRYGLAAALAAGLPVLAVAEGPASAESATDASVHRGPRLDPIGESANATSLSRGPRLDPIGEPEIVPVFVRPLLAQLEKGHNDSSPAWAPGGELLAFERAAEARREIVITRADGALVKTVYYQANEDDSGLGALLPSLGPSVSYNSGIAWSPAADRFVFMSNAGEGNYDLYLGTLSGKATQRLTDDPQKDGQPHWSPAGGPVVFVSGRTGGAQLFLLDADTRQTLPITKGEKAYLYPRWSPDGKRIAAIYGANENHDIVVLDDVPRPRLPAKPGDTAKAAEPAKVNEGAKTGDGAKAAPVTPPLATQRQLTTWSYDDLSPAWSPDGKRIAFYSNYNP